MSSVQLYCDVIINILTSNKIMTFKNESAMHCTAYSKPFFDFDA